MKKITYYREIINTRIFNIPLPAFIYSHAGLLLESDVFEYGIEGHTRRNVEECRGNFDFDIGGLPEGWTNVSPD